MQPFSLGPRACLGKQYVPILPPSLPILDGSCLLTAFSLADREMRLILCKLLFNFDLHLQPECVGWPDQKVYYLWSKPPLLISLMDRFPDMDLSRVHDLLGLFSR